MTGVREKRRGVVLESVEIVEKNVVRSFGEEESMGNFLGRKGRNRSFMVRRVQVQVEVQVRSSVTGTSGLTSLWS
jgi:hypothetical protein